MTALEDFLARAACKGAHCAECRAVFTADRGDGKKLLVIRDDIAVSLYVLCANCWAHFQALDAAGIPEVVRDRKMTVAMSPYNPANAAAFRHMH
jgi:hypothetical protein